MATGNLGGTLLLTRGVVGQRDRIEMTQRPLPDGCRDGQAEGDKSRGGEASDETPKQAVAPCGLKSRCFGGICAHIKARVIGGRHADGNTLRKGCLRDPVSLILGRPS